MNICKKYVLLDQERVRTFCGKPISELLKLIYIAVKLLSGPSLGVLDVIIWSKFVFFLKHRWPKNTIKIVVSAPFFGKMNCARIILEVIIWSKLAFLRRTQLGPDTNFQLGPDNNFQKCHYFCNVLL